MKRLANARQKTRIPTTKLMKERFALHDQALAEARKIGLEDRR
jgi:hypothetical protein